MFDRLSKLAKDDFARENLDISVNEDQISVVGERFPKAVSKNIFEDMSVSVDFDAVNKISNKSKGDNLADNVDVFFTKDQNLLDQYYELREELFREVDDRYKKKHPECQDEVIDYDGSEIDADRYGNIIVIVDKKGKVVGGMRCLSSDFIEYSTNEEPETGFTIKEFLKNYNLNVGAKFSEASAVVIKKGYRNRNVMEKMFDILFKLSISMGCDYVVGIAIAAACRDHRIATKNLGYKLDIMMDYPWIKQREHGDERRYPVVVYLKSKPI